MDFTFDGSHRGCWNGIRFPFTSVLQDSSVFEYCIFEYAKETGDEAKAGGAISLQYYSNLRIENSIFRFNIADRGGAIACRNFSAPLLINNLFSDNYALDTGSVIYNEYSYPLLAHNTITSNHSINPDIWTPSCTLTDYFSKPKLFNNILWENTTEYFQPAEIFEPRPYNYGCNDIQQENLNLQNLNINPFLQQDYSLNDFSPCIDAGGLLLPVNLPDFDLAGNPRLTGVMPDLGCFEFQQVNNGDVSISSASEILLYPNPFNPSINIGFSLEKPQKVRLQVFDIRGRMIYEHEAYYCSGAQSITWNGISDRGEKAASGIYIFQLNCHNQLLTAKSCLLK
ncbi:MAG: T9SS type A sorting domain-containing protein [Candidatus Cloacimonetes bacterium]|nr:T9SS type A sorting domain-containing protein [Candidatus Cloacimonadota bacterium]